MQLMKQTASLTNHLFSRMIKGQPEPVVGMGATVLSWTDRHAGTIVEVGTFRKLVSVVVQEDTATRTDKNGMSECQSYDYAANPNGAKYRFAFDRGMTTFEAIVNMAMIVLKQRGQWQGGATAFDDIDLAVNNVSDLIPNQTCNLCDMAVSEIKRRCGIAAIKDGA